MTDAFAELAALVQHTTGMTMARNKETALRLAVGRAAPDLEPDDFLHALEDPALGPVLIDRLIDEVTVHETSFARDLPQLASIDWRALLQAVPAGPGAIRVWCAGCASGEEVYTLALLAAEAFAPSAAPVDILGTDVSAAMIAAAEAGRYRQRSVRQLDPRLCSRHLEPLPDGGYGVGPHLRRLARFGRHNLVLDPCPPPGEPAFDLVVCRNVLIYFTPALARRVAGALRHSLRSRGMLLLGAADALQLSTGHSEAGPGWQDRPERAPEPDRPGQAAHPRTPDAHQEGGLHPAAGAHPAGDNRPAAGAHAAGDDRPAAGAHPAANDHLAAGRTAAAAYPAARDKWLAAALTAAGAGDRDEALEYAASLAGAHPLDADAQFLHGLVALEAGNPERARDALRRALCADPAFCLAAFTLGRAYDALGDRPAARRAYGQALRTLDPADRKHESLLQQVDLADIAAACRARLAGLR